MRYPSLRPLPLGAQLMHLRALAPTGQGMIERSLLTWRQAITPHALSSTYQCEVRYKVGGYPHVYCVDPPLSVLAAGRRLPHVYERTEPVEICLFMRRRECWDDTMLLARVVLPLAAFWFAHFEHWLFTGDWLGGGTHPMPHCPPDELPHLDARIEHATAVILPAAA